MTQKDCFGSIPSDPPVLYCFELVLITIFYILQKKHLSCCITFDTVVFTEMFVKGDFLFI